MSAALQFPIAWPPQAGQVNLAASAAALQPQLLATAVHHIQKRFPRAKLAQEAPHLISELVLELAPPLVLNLGPELLPDLAQEKAAETGPQPEPINTWAFYRKHTENLLRRYLYASTQVGRSPNLLEESVGRGWVSSRRVRTFEDALIFVLDVERCLKRLDLLERQLITRRILQEYTHVETARLLRISLTSLNTKFPQALDHLTEILVENDLLVLPD